ncbi:beta-N-acetylhexosaminidase [Chitinophaga oryzae]|uniref:beta-N-acetylhexosaminidase n=1 Tax=Chitinophaga oryzae TaxID=2725414 RepID=A0ABX6L8K6_9BACT|nr:beta-N-acetylhexosaminidase [Chitinophaga oryzae]QJB36406.1 beta-N-acetylhexosaminidase [Chitinophaga oryzae]
MKPIFLSILMWACCLQLHAQQACPVIPLPAQSSRANGEMVLNEEVVILTKDNSLQVLATYLSHELQRRFNITNAEKSRASGKVTVIALERGKAGANPDAYTLRMTKAGATITAGSPQGVFNGITTLLQLAETTMPTGTSRHIPCWNITDAPRYAWRGFMLDESRFFFGKEKVKSILDWMAFYKLNRFHWHLTDAPGWRLEIKKYPLLTTVGGIGNHTDPKAPAAFYTQDDIREIVAYAKERFIEVIPEIDMPGHASAANRAYPAFDGGGTEKYPSFTFNPGKEGTYQYLADILKETASLFPSGMIHLGGDEVSFGNKAWDTDTAVISLIKAKGFVNRKQVEDYFFQRMADTVFSLRNKVMAWDEIATATLPANKTIVCWWRQEKPENLKMALGKGYSVIICPRLPFYFDFVQDSTHKTGRKWKAGEYNNLKSVYEFSVAGLPAVKGYERQVLGVQACLWSETISNAKRLDFLLFPRITAFAEAAWTQPASRNFPKFIERLKPQMELFEQARLYYYDYFAPSRHVESGNPTDQKSFID